MGRPRKNPLPPENIVSTTDEPMTESTPTTDAAPIRRRRRRKIVPVPLVSEQSDASSLVAALLRTRGSKGATQDEFHVLVAWARGVRDEAEALQGLSARPRRQKTQAPLERLTRYEMNRALLDGVIAGSIGLDVLDEGLLHFIPQAGTETAAAAKESAMEELEGTDETLAEAEENDSY